MDHQKVQERRGGWGRDRGRRHGQTPAYEAREWNDTVAGFGRSLLLLNLSGFGFKKINNQNQWQGSGSNHSRSPLLGEQGWSESVWEMCRVTHSPAGLRGKVVRLFS